jgi:DNA-binding response OmpR family regulator
MRILIVEDDLQAADAMERGLTEAGIGHTEIIEIGPSLEDVFVTLTQLHANDAAPRKEAA